MTSTSEKPDGQENDQKCTLHVCTSCRTAGMPREPKENRPGFILFNQLHERIKESHLKNKVAVIPAECLSLCPRPCGLAISSKGAWTYLFGDQDPNVTTNEIIECISLYLKSNNGVMKRADRPKSLRSSILGRVPPIQGENKCI